MADNINPVRWIIPPLYAVRFVEHQNGSLYIEFQEGRQMEVFTHLLMSIDMHRQQFVASQKPDISNEANQLVSPDTVKDTP